MYLRWYEIDYPFLIICVSEIMSVYIILTLYLLHLSGLIKMCENIFLVEPFLCINTCIYTYMNAMLIWFNQVWDKSRFAIDWRVHRLLFKRVSSSLHATYPLLCVLFIAT